MKPPAIIALLCMTGCTQPMLSADMAISDGGVSVWPTLSGAVGDTIISVQPN